MSADVKTKIEKILREIADERGLTLPAISDRTEIVDELGFTSLMVATLVAHLEEAFGIDPFQEEDVMITDVRTFQDLCTVYTNSLERCR